MRLTILRRLRICFEVLTTRDRHQTFTHEKCLPIFQRGYVAGLRDGHRESNADLTGKQKPGNGGSNV
jgi:hypothetical protein